MVEVYDNWERLVRATLRREELRLIALRTPSDLSTVSASPSFSFTSPSRSASSFNFSNTSVGNPFAYLTTPQAQYDFSSINLIKHGRWAHLFNGAPLGAVAQQLVIDLSFAIQAQSQYAIQFATLFKELRKQLECMRSFIADVSQLEDLPETIKTLLATLEELIYEADDLVVDCRIREDYQKMKGGSRFPLSLSEISFRYETGKKLTKVISQISRMHQYLKSYYRPVAFPDSEIISGRKMRCSSQRFDQSETLVSREEVATITKWILDQNEPLLRIAIVGMGGLGKTTLAKMIYRDVDLTKCFHEKIWVSLSQSMDEGEIMKCMLKQLKADDTSTAFHGGMLNKIYQLLSNKTYLIVLDDVQSIDNGWCERISCGLPRTEGKKSCIILTSRIKQVVEKMGVPLGRINQLRLLDDEDSWKLFKKVALMASDDEGKNKLVEVGKEIVKKCGGHPLAIKTVGGLLSSVNKHEIDWTRICDNFHDKLTRIKGNDSGSNEFVIASLQLSYEELPAQLKQCLLCFSIYPENYEVEVEQLISWWQAEGFVRDKAPETARELAFNCLAELISRCLVGVTRCRRFDRKPYTCKVHEMVRSLTIKIAGEENFCSFSEPGQSITTSSSHRLGVKSETTFDTLQGNSKLRALILTETRYIGFNISIVLAKIKSLRVLDLSHGKLDYVFAKDLWYSITSLKRLAYLNLGFVAKLNRVPNIIGKLWGLQVLILRGCNDLKLLPLSISNLPRLTILDVGRCPQLQCLPEGLSRLFNLQELYGFKIAGPVNAAGCHLGDLNALTDLRVLQIYISKESTIQDKELEVLAKLQKLRVLSIDAGYCEDKYILSKLDTLSLPSSIEELYLKHYFGETLPGWINPKTLPQLQYLCIEDSRTKEMTKDFWGDKYHKWDVKGLCLQFCQRLHLSWHELLAVMPGIRYLQVSHCYSLESFPCDVSDGFWQKEKNKTDGDVEIYLNELV